MPERTIRLTRLLLLLLTCMQLVTINAMDGPGDFSQFNEAEAPGSMNSNDEVYGPELLQQEIDIERLQAKTAQDEGDEPLRTEYPLKDSVEENITGEDYDAVYMHVDTMPTAAPTMHSATIPAYVRKAKAEHFSPTAAAEESLGDPNSSMSDYIDQPNHSQQNNNNNNITGEEDDYRDDENKLPFAIKFYQRNRSGSEKNIREGDKILQQDLAPVPAPVALLQQQNLPELKQAQAFKPPLALDDDYYEDSVESKEQHGTGSVRHNQNWATDNSIDATPPISDEHMHNLTTIAPVAPAVVATTETILKFTPLVAQNAANETTNATSSQKTPCHFRMGAQGKQLTSNANIKAHEQLRSYVTNNYLRYPIAIIVDLTEDSLSKARMLWRETLKSNINIKIMLITISNSVPAAAYSFNSSAQFLNGLNALKEGKAGNAFPALIRSTQLIPYDSAIFLSTAAIPSNLDELSNAAITIVKKRIRLYLIFFDEQSSKTETWGYVGGILGEIAIRSGGEIIHISGSKASVAISGPSVTLVADSFIGSQEVEIPVDTTISGLHVNIDAPMRTTTLETPNGDIINLRKLVKFKSNVFPLDKDDKGLIAYVPINKICEPEIYKLKIVPHSLIDEYKVFVWAERKADILIDDIIKHFESYFVHGYSTFPSKFYNSHLQMTNNNLVLPINTHSELRFPETELETTDANEMNQSPKNEVETFSETEIRETANTNKTISADAVSKQRSSNVLQKSTTRIDMGVQSQLLVAPGTTAQLYFEVTNTRSDQSVYHTIQVVDERRFLLQLSPQSLWLRPNEMVNVIVTVLVPNGTPQGTIDRITFTCHGGETSSLSLNLKVASTIDTRDTTSPSISWFFGNRCENIGADSTRCAERYWTMDITAQDWESGILRLQSTPTGLIHLNSYTVGSTEPLKASYVATCCEPKVSLTAYDVAGNQRTYSVDVRDIFLTEAAIAAIVLGVLLIIILIVLLIVGIVWCCRRREVSLDLPTYRSHSTRSME